MLKKFVPLTSSASPSQNPYEVRTYLGGVTDPRFPPEICERDRKCEKPNSTISKVLTIEDEIRKVHEKAQRSRFLQPFKKRCALDDMFTMCVVPQRTPAELHLHAEMRENYLKAKYQRMTRVHDGSGLKTGNFDLVRLDSPIVMRSEGEEEEDEDDGEEEDQQGPVVKPMYASPTCSLDLIYAAPKNVLELKRPKSGMFHNESERPDPCERDDIPFSTYNPRILQEKLEDSGLNRLDLIEAKDTNDLWTWNIGLQEDQDNLQNLYVEAILPNYDCADLQLSVFKIPKDLDKTFTAEIVFGNETVLPTPPKRKRSYYNRPKEMACLFVAFVETYRLNPDFWTAETMDDILVLGEKLLTRSTKMNYKSPDTDFDIMPQITERNAEVTLRVHFSGPLEKDPNIYKALSLYFSKYNAAILVSGDLYLLIWKRCSNYFYVFDANGRNEMCQRDFEDGKVSLMATRFVEHLVHLIINFSEIDVHGDYTLLGISLKNFGRIMQPMKLTPAPKPFRKLWAVVNSSYAIIPGTNNGIQQPVSGNEPNASMVISMLSILYADIERAKLWRTEQVDDLVKFGEAYFKLIKQKFKFKPKQHLNIFELPNRLMMGAFRASLQKRPFLYTGHVADCKNFLDSQLTKALKELFDNNYESALMQIDNSVLAVWRDHEYFYVFDPFRRGKAGQVLDPEDYLTKGVAVLQMHTNFESFIRTVYMKAIKMRRGGKFFIHGTMTGCIRPVPGKKSYKHRFPYLNLAPPKYSEGDIGGGDAARASAKSKGKKGKTTKSKKDKGKGKINRHYSIHTIPSEDLIAAFEDVDVVEGVIEEILCDIIKSFPEDLPIRSACYKQVDKVLLRSDKCYLEQLKHKLKHGEDFDNIYSEYKTHPEPPDQPMTLEEELQVPSNFEILPDGSWIIFGTSQLPIVAEELGKASGLLAGLITGALSAKYKISTWNSDLIEYALEAVNKFGENFQDYQTVLGGVLSKNIPKIAIGEHVFRINILKIVRSNMLRSLRQVLLESLIQYNRLLVICQRFSCVIFKRYNFLYMFVGFPVNTVGYRKFGSGPGCLLRFVELDSLIRRIEFGCNPQGCEITNYVAVALKIEDVTNEIPDRFREWPPDDQKILYDDAFKEYKRVEQSKLEKMKFLDRELQKENERIEKFLATKREVLERRKKKLKGPLKISTKSQTDAAKKKGKRRQTGGYEEEEEDELDFEMEEMEQEEEEIELKHKPGKQLPKEIDYGYRPRPVVYGYRMREKSCLYKIQGSMKLENRAEAAVDKIKPCFFASTLALLYAILRPLNQWTSHRVDRVIENAKLISNRVTNKSTANERMIEGVMVDFYKFDIWVKTFEPTGVKGYPLQRKIESTTLTRRYFLLQLANCTYAIYKDEFYHLFDPYDVQDSFAGEEDEEEEDESEAGKKGGKKKCPRSVLKYRERGTASWVLFVDAQSLVKYIDQHASNPQWREDEEYKFHVVDVVTYKKAAPSKRILQLLIDLSVPICSTKHHGEDESNICAHNECLSWLDLEHCLPVWSRMNRRNTSGHYRNLPLTKLKKYDIEITGRLWSLWGNLHPQAPVFENSSRGKQYLACNVMACCAARIYPLVDWSPQLLDTIVISGDKYHRESLATIKRQDYEFSLEDLNIECSLENIKFVVHLEHVAFGKLYCSPSFTKMNLAEALMYFFGHYQFGILQCYKRSLAIGRTLGHDGGYFLFDCQSRDHPLFPNGQGASYVLRTKHLQVLLYCIVVTLNIPYYNVQFSLHTVELLRDGAAVVDDGEEEEEEN